MFICEISINITLICQRLGSVRPVQQKIKLLSPKYGIDNPSLTQMSTIFYQIFIFSPYDSLLKTIKNVFFLHLKGSFHSQDIQIFVIFSLPFHIFQIQKDKWKWNNL